MFLSRIAPAQPSMSWRIWISSAVMVFTSLHAGCAFEVKPCTAVSQRADRGGQVRLSGPASERRGTDGRCRQAARETIKGRCRQGRERRTGARKFPQSLDPGSRQPDTACRSRVGRTPDMNEDTRAASCGAIGATLEDEVFVATGAAIFHGAMVGRGSEVRGHGAPAHAP